jgi:hypothetical protein
MNSWQMARSLMTPFAALSERPYWIMPAQVRPWPLGKMERWYGSRQRRF